MRLDKKDMVLYAVTDRHWLNGESLYSQVEKALKGGATFIQLREKIWVRKSFWQKQNEDCQTLQILPCTICDQ